LPDLFTETRVERVALERATTTDTCRLDEATLGVQVLQLGQMRLAQVGGRLAVARLETVVVVGEDRFEQLAKRRVRLGVGCIDAHATVQIGDAFFWV